MRFKLGDVIQSLSSKFIYLIIDEDEIGFKVRRLNHQLFPHDLEFWVSRNREREFEINLITSVMEATNEV